jgi:hypothetical protein
MSCPLADRRPIRTARTRRSAFVYAAVLAVLVVVGTVAPAGAASPEACSAFAATLTVKPPLPTTHSVTKVKPVLALAGTLNHCTGPEHEAGSLSLAVKISVPINCGSSEPKTVKTTETIKWADGKTSTVAGTIPVFGDSQSLDGTVASGVLKGLHQAAALTGSAPGGTCFTKPLSTETLTLPKNAKFVFE